MPNTGTLTGLAPQTGYVLDAVHVDDWGNVSDVLSSGPFTTEAGSPAAIAPYLGTHVLAGDAGAGGVYTFPSVALGTGEIVVGLTYLSANTPRTITGLTVNGVAAPQVRLQSSFGAAVAAIHKVVCNAATGDIVLNLSGNVANGVAIHVWGPGGTTSVTAVSGADGEPPGAFQASLDLDVAEGGKIVAVAAGFGLSGFTWNSLTGIAEIPGAARDVQSNDFVSAFEAGDLPAGTPRAVGIGSTDGGLSRYAIAALSMEAA